MIDAYRQSCTPCYAIPSLHKTFSHCSRSCPSQRNLCTVPGHTCYIDPTSCFQRNIHLLVGHVTLPNKISIPRDTIYTNSKHAKSQYVNHIRAHPGLSSMVKPLRLTTPNTYQSAAFQTGHNPDLLLSWHSGR